MCPHSCVVNLPKPREQQSDVGPAAMFVGNIVQGARIAGAKGRQIADDERVIFSCTFQSQFTYICTTISLSKTSRKYADM